MVNEIEETILPGRTPEEDKTLDVFRSRHAKAVDRFEAARKVPGSGSSNINWQERGELKKLDKLDELSTAVDEAARDWRAKVKALAEERRRALPIRTVSIEWGFGDADSNAKWWVSCTTADGQRHSLGACTDVGSQEARVRWFEREVAARTA